MRRALHSLISHRRTLSSRSERVRALGRSTYRAATAVSRPISVGMVPVRSFLLTLLYVQSLSSASSHTGRRMRTLGRSTHRNVSAVSRPISVGMVAVSSLDPTHLHAQSSSVTHRRTLSSRSERMRPLGRSTYSCSSAVSRPISVGMDPVMWLRVTSLHAQIPSPASSHITAPSQVAVSACNLLGGPLTDASAPSAARSRRGRLL